MNKELYAELQTKNPDRSRFFIDYVNFNIKRLEVGKNYHKKTIK
jgi:hypothetical protein